MVVVAVEPEICPVLSKVPFTFKRELVPVNVRSLLKPSTKVKVTPALMSKIAFATFSIVS